MNTLGLHCINGVMVYDRVYIVTYMYQEMNRVLIIHKEAFYDSTDLSYPCTLILFLLQSGLGPC